MQNVAMDEAVRLLGAELGKMSETVTMGTYVWQSRAVLSAGWGMAR